MSTEQNRTGRDSEYDEQVESLDRQLSAEFVMLVGDLLRRHEAGEFGNVTRRQFVASIVSIIRFTLDDFIKTGDYWARRGTIAQPSKSDPEQE